MQSRRIVFYWYHGSSQLTSKLFSIYEEWWCITFLIITVIKWHKSHRFFDGDALTDKRSRNIQWVFKDGDEPFDRLEGLDPVHADWHAKAKP